MNNTELSIAAVRFASNEDGSYSISYKPQDVFAALKVAVPKIKGFKVKNVSEIGLALDVKNGMNWKSMGETISISVVPSASEDSIIRIKSKSACALIDWGKNKENINSILSALQNELNNPKYKKVDSDIPKEDSMDKLLKLKDLFDKNIINAEEYANKKEELLKQL